MKNLIFLSLAFLVSATPVLAGTVETEQRDVKFSEVHHLHQGDSVTFSEGFDFHRDRGDSRRLIYVLRDGVKVSCEFSIPNANNSDVLKFDHDSDFEIISKPSSGFPFGIVHFTLKQTQSGLIISAGCKDSVSLSELRSLGIDAQTERTHPVRVEHVSNLEVEQQPYAGPSAPIGTAL